MSNPTVVINGVTYADCPEVDIPKSGSGTAKFFYTGDADITAGDVLSGKVGFGSTGTITGNISSKSAATYTPSGSSQTISSGQYLSGAQTIEAVVCTNLSASNIKSGVTVKIGTASDDDSVTSVAGSLSVPTISQDGSSHILSIS